MTFHPERPYNMLPDLPPELARLETPAIFRQIIAARSRLAELKGYCQTLPNPELLLSAVVLQEGKDSSAIENIVTTQDELFRAAAASGAPVPSATKEVLRYREAMYLGWDELKRTGLLTTNTMVRIMQRVRDTDAGIRRQTGTVIGHPATGAVIYTPPEGETLIRDKLHALERFIHEEQSSETPLDPLLRMALVHYQFEAIHPFSDGNGRTGRILNVLLLLQQDLLDYPVLYLSAYILRHRPDYYRLLRRVTEAGDWAAWVTFMLTAVESTARTTLRLVQAIGVLLEEVAEEAKAGMKNGYSRDLIRLLFRQPYCKIQFLVDEGLASRVTASRYLNDLERLGLVRSLQVHRDKYFINHRLMALLNNVPAML